MCNQRLKQILAEVRLLSNRDSAVGSAWSGVSWWMVVNLGVGGPSAESGRLNSTSPNSRQPINSPPESRQGLWLSMMSSTLLWLAGGGNIKSELL